MAREEGWGMTRAYGSWAGSPKGFPEKADKCVVEVSSGDGWHYHQCTRKRGHGINKDMCAQHSEMNGLGVSLLIPRDRP